MFSGNVFISLKVRNKYVNWEKYRMIIYDKKPFHLEITQISIHELSSVKKNIHPSVCKMETNNQEAITRDEATNLYSI